MKHQHQHQDGDQAQAQARTMHRSSTPVRLGSLPGARAAAAVFVAVVLVGGGTSFAAAKWNQSATATFGITAQGITSGGDGGSSPTPTPTPTPTPAPVPQLVSGSTVPGFNDGTLAVGPVTGVKFAASPRSGGWQRITFSWDKLDATTSYAAALYKIKPGGGTDAHNFGAAVTVLPATTGKVESTSFDLPVGGNGDNMWGDYTLRIQPIVNGKYGIPLTMTFHYDRDETALKLT